MTSPPTDDTADDTATTTDTTAPSAGTPDGRPPDLTEQLRRHMVDLRAVLRADIGHESHLLQAELIRYRGELGHELAVATARSSRRLAQCERRLTLRLTLALIVMVAVTLVTSGVVVVR